jgi:hypothetical protein
MIRSAMSIVVASGLITFSTVAFAAEPTQADFDACNREAQTKVGRGHSPSASGATDQSRSGATAGAGHTTTSPAQGVTSGGTSGSPGATESSRESPSGATGAVAGVAKSVRGISSAGQDNLAYVQAYRECMKSRGFAAL